MDLKLTDEEQKLVDCAMKGDGCIFEPNKIPTVRAKVIEELAAGSLKDKVHRKGVWLVNATIDGKLDLESASITSPLVLENCHISQGINLRDAKTRLLSFNKCTISSSIKADRIEVDGAVLLRDAKIDGGTCFSGAKISGNFELTNASLDHQGKVSLSCQGAQIGGGLLLNNGFCSLGKVDLHSVKIGTNLECGGAIINAREHALACDQAQVGGSIHFIKGFRAGGEVRLHRAKIEEHLVCTDSSFCGILIAQQMTVKGTFFWQSNNGNEVDLFGASVAQVCDDLSSWCRFHKITLDNFTYGTLAKVGKIEDRIGWIEKSQNSEYLPQLYEQMAKVLKEMGCRGWAQEVMVAQHRRREQFGNLSRREKTQSQLYGLIDYGYMPWRKSMKYLFLTWLVGWLVIPPFSTSPKSRVKPQGPTSAWA